MATDHAFSRFYWAFMAPGASFGPEPPPSAARTPSLPSVWDIKALATQKLGFPPCRWQLELAQALLKREQQVIFSTAATCAGKSVTFWLPLLYERNGVTFVIVPLKQLGQQLADDAASYGFSSINVTREVLREDGVMKVRPNLYL